jgi:outer membrane protein OmpA-like peptidoglycan-associated protein
LISVVVDGGGISLSSQKHSRHWRIRVKSNNRNWILLLFAYAFAFILLISLALPDGASKAHHLSQGESSRFSGLILSRDGELIRVHDKKSGEVVVVRIDDSTKVERTKYNFPFYRHIDMDVTALLPGLTIEAEGVGNSAGQLDARKISFSPDEFAIEVAEEQQILANKVSEEGAQLSANRAADNEVNERVSDLDGYKNEFEVDVFFPEGSTVLGETAKRDLDNLADIAKSLSGYMIEISGYAAHHKFSIQEDQKLSEERAAAVAGYFLEIKHVPMRRILVPVGYGASHPVANNEDAHGRELNRHVDIKVLVNKNVGQDM